MAETCGNYTIENLIMILFSTRGSTCVDMPKGSQSEYFWEPLEGSLVAVWRKQMNWSGKKHFLSNMGRSFLAIVNWKQEGAK